MIETSGVVAIILASSSAVVGIVTAIFHSASLSRCKKIICCFGCFDCDREVLSEEIYAQENNVNNT